MGQAGAAEIDGAGDASGGARAAGAQRSGGRPVRRDRSAASNGPLFAETDYLARGRVLAVSETPKTEFFWYETTLTDPVEGNDVASMPMMLRLMKASSPLLVGGRR